MSYTTIGCEVQFYTEADVFLFSARSDIGIVEDMQIAFTPVGGSETIYKVETVTISLSQLSEGDSDHEPRYTNPIVKVAVSALS